MKKWSEPFTVSYSSDDRFTPHGLARINSTIMSLVGEKETAERNIFADFRTDGFYELCFVPAQHIEGDNDNDVECDSCERTVKLRTTSIVIEADPKSEPMHFCHSCSAMAKRAGATTKIQTREV